MGRSLVTQSHIYGDYPGVHTFFPRISFSFYRYSNSYAKVGSADNSSLGNQLADCHNGLYPLEDLQCTLRIDIHDDL
jgi:hypothetical protein